MMVWSRRDEVVNRREVRPDKHVIADPTSIPRSPANGKAFQKSHPIGSPRRSRVGTGHAIQGSPFRLFSPGIMTICLGRRNMAFVADEPVDSLSSRLFAQSSKVQPRQQARRHHGDGR